MTHHTQVRHDSRTTRLSFLSVQPNLSQTVQNADITAVVSAFIRVSGGFVQNCSWEIIPSCFNVGPGTITTIRNH